MGRAGRRLGPLQHHDPGAALGGAPGAAEPDHPTANEYRVETALLGQTIASAGITRIRSRRSVTSLPPSQPSRAPVTPPMLPGSARAQAAAPVHNRCDEPRSPRGASARCGASACAPPASTSSATRARRARPRSAAAGGAERRRRHRPAAREGAGPGARSNAPPTTFRRVCDTYSALFIVNDDPELAHACDADGVHVGQDDGSVAAARELLGPDAIIGLSTHSEEQIAAAAEARRRLHHRSGRSGRRRRKRAGRRSACELISHAAEHAPHPFFAIGGIDAATPRGRSRPGRRRLCVVRAIRDAAEPDRRRRSAAARVRAVGGAAPGG